LFLGLTEALMDNIDTYLDGSLLYGDDFNQDQIAEWYADEKEGYADLGAKNAATYRYGYHAWNTYHAYRHLPNRAFANVMGFGSAYGDELLPIISKIEKIIVVDPSNSFVRESVHGVHATYIQPTPDGSLPVPDEVFDLITCFGVLHHIPNVSFVVRELSRTLKPGGFIVIREPIVSMGDWRKPRLGLTKRERGIPLHILRTIAQSMRLRIIRQSLCAFPLTTRMFRMIRSGVYNSGIATKVDAMLSEAFKWNVNYHPRSVWQRFRPTSAFLILQKDPLGSSPTGSSYISIEPN
jgi:SAM-dependent methyltransferase